MASLLGQQQTGIILNGGSLSEACSSGPPRHEVAGVPSPPLAGTLDPAAYAHLLPGIPAEELRAMTIPVSTKVGPGPLVLVHDQRWSANQSAQATMLSVSLTTGFGAEVYGPSLVLFAEPGRDLTMHYFNKLDNLIRNNILGVFEWARSHRAGLASLPADVG